METNIKKENQVSDTFVNEDSDGKYFENWQTDIQKKSGEFQSFVNENSESGYLKEWKATSMVWSLKLMPCIMEDEERLVKYVKNCLTMEGFTEKFCESVSDWIVKNLKKEI